MGERCTVTRAIVEYYISKLMARKDNQALFHLEIHQFIRRTTPYDVEFAILAVIINPETEIEKQYSRACAVAFIATNGNKYPPLCTVPFISPLKW